MRRVLAATAIVVSTFAAGGHSANAQESTAAIVVRVHDRGGTPVRNALVRLNASSAQQSHLGRTDADGVVVFTASHCENEVLLVEARGYLSLRQHVTCDRGSAVIDVALQPELQEIGSTRSAPAPTGRATVSVTPESSIRRANASLLEALDQLSDVSTRDRGIGFSAGIRGQDPALTEYSLNGVPLGGGAASLAINSDLLTSASIDEAGDAVALFSASPTATPLYSAELRFGSYEDSFQKYQTSGTMNADGIGYVAVHTSRGVASELDGKTYLDESGIDYTHRGVQSTIGNLVRLTGATGATSVSLTYSASSMNAEPIPTFFAGDVPAGDGPGTRRNVISSNPVLFVSTPLAAGLLSLSAARWSSSSWTDATSRIVELVPAPQTAFDRTTGTDLTLTFSSAPTQNRSFNATLTQATMSTKGASFAIVGGAPFGGSFAFGSHQSEIAATEDWHANPRVPFDLSLKDSDFESLGGAVSLGIGAQYIMSTRARLRYSGTFGAKPIDLSSSQVSNILADPASAQFDCSGRAAFLSGPGASGTKARMSNNDLSLSAGGGRSTISLSLYQHTYANVAIGNVPLVAASLPSAYFPIGYLNAVEEEYQTVGGCAPALDAEHIFVQQAFVGANALYRGASVAAHFSLSEAWSVDANVGIERAYSTGGDARLMATPYFSGAFLPGVPTYKGNLVARWQRDGGTTAALISTSFVGIHNSRQLPPYATVNAALERRLSPASSAAVLVSNIFDTLTSPFITTALSVPLRDGYGRLIPTFASPLLPRRIELRYTVQLAHRGVPR